MAPNPVKYAEDVLGVHAVWEEARGRLAALEKAVNERAGLLRDLRVLRARIADREADLTADAPTRWPDANSTERGRLLKAELTKDGQLHDWRSEEDDLQATLDILDADIRHDEAGCRVLASRMTELGGLLNFYAATKSNK